VTRDVLAVTAVMARDAARLETGLARLGTVLAAESKPIGAVMLDVDGSAAVRQKGLPAKRALVLALQRLVRTEFPAGRGTVIDSGTRDEILVLMPGETSSGCTQRAADLLTAIRSHPFRSEFWQDDLYVTASLGATLLDPALPPDVAFAAARAALAAAKKDRDCVRFAADDARRVAVPAAHLEASGIQLAEAVTRGVRRVEEKYGPMWYWLGGGEEISVDALREAATVRFAHDAVFLTLVDEIRQESRPPDAKGEAIRRRHEAAAPQPLQSVPLGGWTRATLRRLCDDLAVPQHLMLREALRLADLDRVPARAVRP
jgi:GGDEF domain-containing protein